MATICSVTRPSASPNYLDVKSMDPEYRLHLATRIFENSIEGMTITDSAGVIQQVNPAFTHITGYTAAEVIGKTPRILKSDRHDQKFYRRMWEVANKQGMWQGKIWNRRKNGEIYLEWLTIARVENHPGQACGYVAIFHDMTESRQVEEQLRYQTNYDALTGLPNRIMLLERLKVALAHNRRRHKFLALLVFDLDNFKFINESLGHTTGDLLLQQIAVRCQERIPEASTIARLGGDEFCIILEELENEYLAVELAEELIGALLQPFRVSAQELFVTVSIGITFSPVDGDSAGNLLRNAEMALNQAKALGKNTYRLFTKALNVRVVQRLEMENSMRRALMRKEFQVHYQPKVELGAGRILGMEALVRWERPGFGLVSPTAFIPLAEENGLIVPLGEWVLATACRQAKQFRDNGHELSVAVNLSPRQFAQSNLREKIATILGETGLPPEALQLEITEGLLFDNEEAAIKLLGQLRAMGVKIALDDFGTGYSSLHYLRRLPLDTLKVDRSFIRELPENKDSAAITEAILSMAGSLKLEVVAEGVETEEHLAFLCRRDCNLAQGFLFSPPLTARNFAGLLQKCQGGKEELGVRKPQEREPAEAAGNLLPRRQLRRGDCLPAA